MRQTDTPGRTSGSQAAGSRARRVPATRSARRGSAAAATMVRVDGSRARSPSWTAINSAKVPMRSLRGRAVDRVAGRERPHRRAHAHDPACRAWPSSCVGRSGRQVRDRGSGCRMPGPARPGGALSPSWWASGCHRLRGGPSDGLPPTRAGQRLSPRHPSPSGKTRQVLDAVATNLPSPSRTSPSAKAARRPGLVTRPVAVSSPPPCRTGRR
jgi:hypothetical protein